ncbi:MAG TPA: response regulator [Ktedonobacteraceae bacterium]|nr:response regulator [Ktedonobacteraceae bacterium]
MARHILVVEDDEFLLELYNVLLQDEGYQVSLFDTIFEHVTEVERLHPDLIILDAKLNDREDGLDLLQQLLSYPPTRSLPVLLCTAASAKSTRERVEAFRLQGVPVIYKPFDINELLQTIADILNRHVN